MPLVALLGSLPVMADLAISPAAVTSGGGESHGATLSVIGTIGQAVAADSEAGAPGLVGRAGLWSQLLRWMNAPPVPGVDHSLRRSGDGAQILISRLLANDVDANVDTLVFAGFESVSIGGGVVHREGPWLFYEPPVGVDPVQDLVVYRVTDGFGPAVGGHWVITRGATPPSGPPNALALTVDPADPTRVRVRFQGIIGRTYAVQWAPGIEGPWTTAGEVVAGLDGAMEFVDAAVPETRFYRLIEP